MWERNTIEGKPSALMLQVAVVVVAAAIATMFLAYSLIQNIGVKIANDNI